MRATTSPALGLATPGLLGEGRIVVITDDGNGVAQALLERFAAHGVRAHVGADATSLASAQAVIALDGLRRLSGDSGERKQQADEINFTTFSTARQVAARFTEAGGTFITVQDTGGDFGLSGSDRAWLAGPAALARTAAIEWPKATVRAVDVECSDRTAAQVADALAHELLYGAPQLEVGLRADGTRLRLTLQTLPIESSAAPAVRKHGAGFVVASGGARGVTAACLLTLAAQQQGGRFLLLGRTPLLPEPDACADAVTEVDVKRKLALAARASGANASLPDIARQAASILAVREIRGTLAQLEATGSQARYETVDATDVAAVTQVLARWRTTWGPVTGVVHAAGVLADKLIADKTDAQFHRVMRTKVDGARALLDATRNDALEFILLFSSVAARSGNLGQCDYAMANEVLNKVAAWEQQQRGDACVVRALGWGPWDGGMVDDGLKARFASMGVSLIPLQTGAKAFVSERLYHSRAAEVILGGDEDGRGLAGSEARQAMHADIIVGALAQPYLTDHRVKGVPVVPVALVLEWLARAAAALHPELHISRLYDLKVLRGLRLPLFDARHETAHERTQQERLQVRAWPVSNGGQASLALALTDANGRPHYTAACELMDHLPSPVRQETLTNADNGRERAMYERAPLFHGPAFRMLRSLKIHDDSVTAELVGVADCPWRSDAATPWQLDPVALDAALQLALVWAHENTGGNALPTGIEALRIYVPGPLAGPLHAVLRGRHCSGTRHVCDVAFFDASGVIQLELQGIETHVLPGQALTELSSEPSSELSSEPSSELSSEPDWKPAS